MSKNLTKQEVILRQEQEKMLKGSTDNIAPSEHLIEGQVEIFNTLVNEMKASNILSNLDVYVLDECATSIYWLRYIDDIINRNPDNLFDKQVMTTREKYLKSFQRCCNELSLSPQSRAKLGNINIAKKEQDTDPILNALKVIK